MSNHEEVSQNEFRKGTRALFRSYLIGFITCLILTTVAFDLVQHHVLPNNYLYVVLTLLLIGQFFAQVIFFLRLNTDSEEGRWNWNMISFVFTIFTVAVLVVGTLWIMYNLNYYMVH